jgi:hypothetical protein
MSFNQQVYRVGDFVYAEPKERGMDASIINIERLWTNQEGQQMMYGNYFYRPNETYHVTTRRFLEKVTTFNILWKENPGSVNIYMYMVSAFDRYLYMY